MGITCKPCGEFGSIMKKLDNQLAAHPTPKFSLGKEKPESAKKGKTQD